MSKFLAGAAKICVDPTPEMLPLPGIFGTWYEDVYASSYNRALAIDNGESKFLIITFPFGSGGEEAKSIISEKYDIPTEHIIFANTHNHGGPAMKLVAEQFLPDTEPSHQQRLWAGQAVPKCLQAADEAFANLHPARFGYGEGKSYININRNYQLADGSFAQLDNPEGCSDKTLSVTRIEDYDGNVIAALVNYAAHAIATFRCTDQDGKTKINGDFPEYASQFLENRYPGSVFLWTTGAAGNQNVIPLFKGDKDFHGYENVNMPAPCGLGFRYAEYIGQLHALDIDKTLKQIICDDGVVIHSACTTVEFDGQEIPGLKGKDYIFNIMLAQNSVPLLHELFPEKAFSEGKDRPIVMGVPCGEKVTMGMQLVTIGSVAYVAMNSEPFNEIGLLCKEKSPFKNTVLITCSDIGPCSSYLVDDDSAKLPLFQNVNNRVLAGNSNTIVSYGMLSLFKKIFNQAD